jgi:hypothetical protein
MTRDEMKLRNVAAMGEALGKQYTILFSRGRCAAPVLEGIFRVVRHE